MTKTIAIRDDTLHQHLLDLKKEKGLKTVEAVITMLLATFETFDGPIISADSAVPSS